MGGDFLGFNALMGLYRHKERWCMYMWLPPCLYTLGGDVFFLSSHVWDRNGC